MRLKNKTALITGAGRGIGLAGALAFAREGAKVVIAEIDEELGTKAEAAVRGAGGEAAFVRTDCADSAGVQALMARTETALRRAACALQQRLDLLEPGRRPGHRAGRRDLGKDPVDQSPAASFSAASTEFP